MDKNDAEKIKEFQNAIKYIDLKKGDEFEDLIVEILRKVTRSKVCSIYWHRNDYMGDHFQLGASTSNFRYNFKSKTVEEIKSVKNTWALLNDEKNILSKVFLQHRSMYLYNLKDTEGLDTTYYQSVFPKFVELPKYKDRDLVFEFIQRESVFAIPIWSKDQKIKGIVLFVGKEHNLTTISTSFWEQDRTYIEFFTNVISRFIDAYDADKEREKFLHQLGHELLAPITEIVYENNSLLNVYARDKNIGNRFAFRQLKDNLNAAMYFKHILDDVEFGYGHVDVDTYNIELVTKPKDVILNVVQLFEKKAHAEKQIAIRTNISEIPPIYMDKTRIQQVLINLLRNAIQYSNSQTIIDIYYNEIESIIDGYPLQKWHEIVVVNSGIGIPEIDQDSIFEIYYRSQNAIAVRPAGVGIGLYIVKIIMLAHHGDCIVKRLNNPTEVAIYLPYKQFKIK
jgi:signal transduction histidine kinase